MTRAAQAVQRLLAGHDQVLLELAAEEPAARRVVERERRERVNHAVLAGVLAVERLDAHDRQHHVLRHAAGRGPPESLGMLARGLDATRNSPVGDEPRRYSCHGMVFSAGRFIAVTIDGRDSTCANNWLSAAGSKPLRLAISR